MSWDLKALVGPVPLQSIPATHGSIAPTLRKYVEPRKFPVSTIQFSDFPGSIIEFAKLRWLLLLQKQCEP